MERSTLLKGLFYTFIVIALLWCYRQTSFYTVLCTVHTEGTEAFFDAPNGHRYVWELEEGEEALNGVYSVKFDAHSDETDADDEIISFEEIKHD